MHTCILHSVEHGMLCHMFGHVVEAKMRWERGKSSKNHGCHSSHRNLPVFGSTGGNCQLRFPAVLFHALDQPDF